MSEKKVFRIIWTENGPQLATAFHLRRSRSWNYFRSEEGEREWAENGMHWHSTPDDAIQYWVSFFVCNHYLREEFRTKSVMQLVVMVAEVVRDTLSDSCLPNPEVAALETTTVELQSNL